MESALPVAEPDDPLLWSVTSYCLTTEPTPANPERLRASGPARRAALSAPDHGSAGVEPGQALRGGSEP